MLQWNGKDLTSEDVYFMSESFSRAARSAREMARMLLRWLVLALPIGLLCGGIGTAFHLAVEAVTELRGAHGWLLWLLPAAGLAIVALYKGTKCEGVGTNNVIRAVQSGEAVSPLLVPAIFFGTVLTHLCGGSAGREGAALQMGGSIGYNIAKLFHFPDHDRRTATVCGMAAFFSALFGTPLAATLFAMMVEDVGLSFSVAFVPGFCAALLAYGIMDCPFKTYPADVLNKLAVPNPSAKVKEVTQSSSVAEAAAIQSAGGGFLLLEKQKGQLGESNDYTFAVAMDKSVQRQGHIEIVGAGPGDPELISIRGRRMLEKADLILYAGSLVPKELTYCAKPGATVRSSADMNLEEQFILMKEFYDRGKFVVRLHTGDPCIYGAIQEQMAFFDQFHMSYHITPGISSFQAAAAALHSQFTIPEKVQTIILTRGEGRTPMPEKEQLHKLAASQSTMCIYLSAGIADKVQEELLEHYAPTTPVAACYKLTWKDERIYRGELKDLAKIVKENHLTLTTLLVVGDAIDNREGLSRLYADEFKHLFRK